MCLCNVFRLLLYYHKQPSFEIIPVPFALSASVFAIAEGSHCNLSHKAAVRFLPYNRHTIVMQYYPMQSCRHNHYQDAEQSYLFAFDFASYFQAQLEVSIASYLHLVHKLLPETP